MGSGVNLQLEKRLNIFAYIFSAIVLLLVSAMRSLPKFDIGIDLAFLPPVHALLNGAAAVCLLFALYFIKQKNVLAHRRMIYAALTCSALFLVCYVLYHSTTQEVKYGDLDHNGAVDAIEAAAAGGMRSLYLLVLITHITLAGLILPFIFLTFNRAFTNQFDRHKKMARWVYPLWLYVAITGPICYLMLKPYY